MPAKTKKPSTKSKVTTKTLKAKSKTKSKVKKWSLFRGLSRTSKIVVAIVVLLSVGAIGTYFVNTSRANTDNLSLEGCYVRGRNGKFDEVSGKYICYSSCRQGAGVWKPNGDGYGYCSNAITESIGHDKCVNSLERQYVGYVGCARVWQQVKTAHALQCQDNSDTYFVRDTYDFCADPDSGGGTWQWPVSDAANQGPSLCWNDVYNGLHHAGLDINVANGSHSAVYAAAAGTVTTRSYDSGGGNHIIIKHGTALYSVYEHLSSWDVSVGQHVNKGQFIGRTGVSGNSSGEHLHFGVTVDGSEGQYTSAPQPNSSSRTRDPLNFLPHKSSYARCY
jgi:hypothetical protein